VYRHVKEWKEKGKKGGAGKEGNGREKKKCKEAKVK